MAAVAVAGLALAAASTSSADLGASSHLSSDTLGHSTLEQRIFGESQTTLNDPDDPATFDFLELGGGEGHLVRENLAEAQPGRADRRESLIYLGQITDFQLADEESPVRVDFLDAQLSENDFADSGWRPQEALVPHQVEWTIRQLNRFVRSPVEQGDGENARMENAVMTGDVADNMQRNETRWVVQLLEGGVFSNGQLVRPTLDPNSGTSNLLRYPPACQLAVLAGRLRPAEASRYTGVQDYDDYPTGGRSSDFYDPDEPFGDFELWPTYEGLLDRAQEPFRVRGLRVPSYVAFGNHDGLVQGNEDARREFEQIGTSCLKFFPTPDSPDAAQNPVNTLRKLDAQAQGPLPQGATFVPPDVQRQFVDKRQFKRQFRRTGFQADGHGFAYVDRRELNASHGAAAYYSFVPETEGPPIRYIVLDTLSEGGVIKLSENGNLDDPQFRWLREELAAAERRDELVLVFGHHATGSMTARVPDELATRCTRNDEHGHNIHPGCDRDPRSSLPLHLGDDLIRLFHRRPNVLAYIAGHSHENQIQPFEDGDGSGAFWEIKSPAIADWPPQHRLIEVMDNHDGTLSIFATMLDHGSPVAAPQQALGPEVNGFGSSILASIGRTITFNDPQKGPGGPEGQHADRNVELLIADPRD